MEIHHSAAPLTGLLLRDEVKVPARGGAAGLSPESTAHFRFANLEHLSVATAGPAAATGERPWFRAEGGPGACKIPASGDGCSQSMRSPARRDQHERFATFPITRTRSPTRSHSRLAHSTRDPAPDSWAGVAWPAARGSSGSRPDEDSSRGARWPRFQHCRLDVPVRHDDFVLKRCSYPGLCGRR
jgi:hypothetical protein